MKIWEHSWSLKPMDLSTLPCHLPKVVTAKLHVLGFSGPPAHSWLAFLIISFGQDYANTVIAKNRYYPSWLDILGYLLIWYLRCLAKNIKKPSRQAMSCPWHTSTSVDMQFWRLGSRSPDKTDLQPFLTTTLMQFLVEVGMFQSLTLAAVPSVEQLSQFQHGFVWKDGAILDQPKSQCSIYPISPQ